jgi:two-component system response regulator YesN
LDNKQEQNSHEIVEKAKCYIMEHLADDLSVSDIASYLYVSPNYLSKLFKRTTGEGCNEYIIKKRIEKAKLLLETTNIKTCKIAEMVGYKDTNYFSMAVKKNTGMSPKMYREACQKNANRSSL